jgi:hypothetical protein
MSLLENRGTMERRERRVEASGATGPVASSPVLSLSTVHYPLSLIHCSLFIIHYSLLIILKIVLITIQPIAIFPPATPQKPAEMIPVMVSFEPVQYRFITGYDRLSTGKIPVMVGYGRLRKLSGSFSGKKASYEVMSTTL